MKNILTIILFLSVLPKLNAQSPCECADSLQYQFSEEKLTGRIITWRDIYPDQFYTKQWCSGSLKLYNDAYVSNKTLKYNGFTDSFFWMLKPEMQQIILDKNFIQEIRLVEPNRMDTMIFRKIGTASKLFPDTIEHFMQVLTEGKISLLVYRKIAYTTNSQSYFPCYDYYLVYNGKWTKIIIFRKSLLEIYPDKKKELRKLLRKNRLNLRIENDLTRAVNLMNQQF
jgi:hypothetical protein